MIAGCMSLTLVTCGTLYSKGKNKGTFLPVTGHEDPEAEHRYSSTLSLTLALYGVDGYRSELDTLY